jgi:hypothetical protein
MLEHIDLLPSVRPDYKVFEEMRLLQGFFYRGNGPCVGHEAVCLRLGRQQQVPICRHFKRRERRDSNPRLPPQSACAMRAIGRYTLARDSASRTVVA